MIIPDRTSFTALSSISLPSTHILHPGSCNPSMDLIVLLSSPASPSQSGPAYSLKGKGKEIPSKTHVSLWRTGGSKVWQVDVKGAVGGLAWSPDGLILSILSIRLSNSKSIDHLSVHTGEIIRSIPLHQDLGIKGYDVLGIGKWVDMEWRSAPTGWEERKNGSALGIIDSLPKVTPVDPPKPPNALPFMRQTNVIPPKPTLHSTLSAFPALLPSAIPISPDILVISAFPFLTGTFPLPPQTRIPTQGLLELAKASDKMVGFLDVILRGLENAEVAFREGEKQTMICREDLETCAQQQAMSTFDVHSDLFRFLMTGRSGVAVNEWLGSRLTGRTITKWDQTMDTSFRTIQNLINESISPALQRLILLLEEIRGWSRTPKYQTQLHLKEAEIGKAIDTVLGFAKLVERMRRDAEHEMAATAEFMKWLKYEIARAASHDPTSDDLPSPTHDLKLVWSFMINGFVHSSFHKHFPYLLVRPPKDFLPDDHVLYPRQSVKPLLETLEETGSALKIGDRRDIGTPSTRANGSMDDSTTSGSMSMSISIDDDHHLDSDGGGDDGDITPTQVISDDDISRASSPDTVERKTFPPEEQEIQRTLDQEPWVWANSLTRALEGLIKSAIGEIGGKEEPKQDGLLRDKRIVEDMRWEALIRPETRQLWILSSSSSQTRISAFTLFDSEQSTTCLAMQFFDDEEIVLLLESEDGRYLVTIRYSDAVNVMVQIPRDDERTLGEMVDTYQSTLKSFSAIPINRSRYLGPTPQYEEQEGKAEIALNGRKGRRLGCVLDEGGKEVSVWDLDVDEDEEDENGEGDEEMEGVEE
ncbi:uncharacterized protein IL334_007149 [Kwoniella shivajii]|uniref:Anaphase-promoting complex subunit 4 n=1 Tax=Kwoniella shivajii TaxID=564305 RepID=A0ABZ1D8D1_9TREE|nr:hypothetical protein IL334_007149 [Kwoniella shivajii]